jgi:AcrR family transcriptional regulator
MSKKESIAKKYAEFELLEGRPPHSVFEVSKYAGVQEKTFYKYFNNLEATRAFILEELINNTLERLDEDEEYETFSANEKALALFFTLFEELMNKRSYLIFKYSSIKDVRHLAGDWDAFFRQFNARMEQIIQEGKHSEEVISRPYISDYYAKSFKLVYLYAFRVWINDSSEKFQTTDAAIEKSVNLAFEFLGHSPLESILDFGKFAMKTKVV